MPQPVHITCPHCAQVLKVQGATPGKRVRCPRCQEVITVPSSDAPRTSASTLWIVRTEHGQTFGPVSRDELDHWVAEGRLHAQCQLSPDGAQQWIWAIEMFPDLPTVKPSAFASQATPPTGPSGQQSANTSPPKSRLVAGLLGLLLPLAGIYGVHRLYLGHIGMGILMLITCGGCGIWQLIDVILVFAGSVTDADGQPLCD